MRRLRGSKRTATNEKPDDERIPQRQLGNCSRGKCTGELACKDEGKDHYICLCPQDSKAPMADGSCPRHTVPLKPGLIPNVLPPSNVPHASSGAHTISNQTVIETTPAVNYVSEHPANVNSNYNYYLIGGGLSITLTSIIILGLIIRRKCFIRDEHNSMASPINLKSSLLLPKRYAPNPQYTACAGTGVPLLRKETLKFLHEIGEGCFGKVFKGEYSIDVNDKMEIVAIKVLKENATKEAEEDFLREVEIMSAFRHPNILTLLGVVPRDGYINPMMVFEYMSHGDLAELLRCQKKSASYEPDVPQLTSMDLLHIALQISRGMSYLAAQRFVHRDLACRNCLVAQGPVVKIADFGMSRDVYTCDYYKIGGSRLLPVRWMSPESVVYGRFTLESDIWSYGVILWEIYSLGKQPYYGHTNEEVVKLILDGIMLIPPIDCPSIICELMKNCWKTEPRDRIRFASICDKLEAEYENMTPSSHNFHNETDNTFHQKLKGHEGDFKGKLSTLGKSLPRPPPIAQLMQEDILDPQGYLLANEIKDPVQYLETLSG